MTAQTKARCVRRVLSVSGIVLLGLGTGLDTGLFGQEAVPIAREPRHQVVYESGTTRVQDVQIPRGDTTLYHIHDTAILYVPISRSQTRSQVLGQDWSGGESAAPVARSATAPLSARRALGGSGRVSSIISYVDEPVAHRVHNVGDTLFRLIAVSNLSKGSDTVADDVSGLAGRPEVLNRYYRVHRVTLGPGQATAAHRHATPVVIVQQTAGRAGVEGPAPTELAAPGAFAFHDDSGPHVLRNIGGAPVDLIEVELRGGSAK